MYYRNKTFTCTTDDDDVRIQYDVSETIISHCTLLARPAVDPLINFLDVCKRAHHHPPLRCPGINRCFVAPGKSVSRCPSRAYFRRSDNGGPLPPPHSPSLHNRGVYTENGIRRRERSRKSCAPCLSLHSSLPPQF